MNEAEVAKKVFEIEIEALQRTKEIIGEEFIEIVRAITACRGKVVISGIGKSGHIARKISATMASLGTPSFYLHPAEALHGDLGVVTDKDVVILLSNSGESEEILRLLPSLKLIGARLAGITGKRNSTLARECDLVQIMPDMQEACSLNLAPTSSTSAVLAYGDALAVAASTVYGFREEDFALFHPAGALGKKILVKVQDIMATGDAVPKVRVGCRISDAIMEMSSKKLGVVTVVNSEDELIGLLTDGDLRRAIEHKANMYEDIIDTVMTIHPKHITSDILAVQALKNLRENRINNYPVVDERKHVTGVLTWQMIVNAGIVL